MRHIRRGKSLLEAVILISILSIVLGMSATSLVTLFRLRSRFSRDAEQALTLDRLAVRLRSDAHEAVSASLEDGCTLALADGRTIHYAYAAPSMIRQVKRDTAVLHHDTYLLPRHAEVAFENVENAEKRLVRLSIRPGEFRLPARELPRGATIEAAVGLNPLVMQTARRP